MDLDAKADHPSTADSTDVASRAATPDHVIRFGIATDGPILAWQGRAIEALAGVAGVAITRWDRLAPADGADVIGTGSGARRIVAVPACLIGLPSGSDVAGGVDILLDLTAVGVPATHAESSETWRFGYGPTDSRDVAATALFEYVTTPTQARVTLVAEPSGVVLREGHLTCRREERLERVLLDTADWPASLAVGRTRGRGMHPAATTPASVSRDRAKTIPSPVLRIAAIGRRGLRIRTALTRHDDWNVGIIRAPITDVVARGGDLPIDWFPLRPGRFAADPFGVERDGLLHVFFEDYDQREGRGVIAHVAIGSDGQRSDPGVVLDTGVHASYPFLVEDEGITYMLPELSAANELVLYAATSFPNGWERAAILLSGVRAVDATVVEHQGRWWMFATIADRGAGHNLFLWHAPRLTGPWTAHAANPVKTDARSARPGGTPFVVDGILYRPSQDCSRTYGGAVVVSRVDVLTPDAFSETPVHWIRPRPDSPHRDGLHTLSAAGAQTLIDSKTLHLVPGVLQRQVGGRIPFIGRFARPGRP